MHAALKCLRRLNFPSERAVQEIEVRNNAAPTDRSAAGTLVPLKPRRTPIFFVAVVAAIMLLVAGAWWLHRQLTHIFVTDARVAADMVVLSSRVPGWLTAVNVTEGDAASQGAELVRIDDRESRLMVQEMGARIAGIDARRVEIGARMQMIDRQTVSQSAAQQARVRSAEAALAVAVARRNLAELQNNRLQSLVASGAVSRDQSDQTHSALETAQQTVLSAQADLGAAKATQVQVDAAREELNVLELQIAALGPQEEQLRSQKHRVSLDTQDRTIFMPFEGVVDRVFVRNREYVTPGQRLLMVHDPRLVRIDANIKETDIRFFRPGKKVLVVVDALAHQQFEGVVERVGQAATSEFALLPNPNPSGNFTKITQRLPVRISVQQQDNLLKPGMMVELEVRADD